MSGLQREVIRALTRRCGYYGYGRGRAFLDPHHLIFRELAVRGALGLPYNGPGAGQEASE